MKSLKYLMLLAAFAIVGLSSCTKEDVKIDEKDPTEVTPEEGTQNPLMNNISSRSDGALDLACFTIDFPFSLIVGDEQVEITSDDDFIAVFDNLTDSIFIDFVYPLDITYDDETTAVIASGEELGLAFAACLPDDGWGVDSTYTGEDIFPAFLINTEELCYDLVYPVSLTDMEGNDYSANSEDEFIELMAVADDFLFFTFPLILEDEFGEQHVADGPEILFELLTLCEGTVDTTFSYGGEVGCYDINYPFTVTLADGSEVTVNDHDELCALMIESEITGFVYPITLIDLDGAELVINSDEELEEALTACWDEPPFGGDIDLAVLLSGASDFDGNCYDINFPISVNIDSVSTSITSLEELVELFLNPAGDFAQLVYPVSVTLIASGEVVAIENVEQLFAILEDCE